ncbi:MAG: helix-turn-helix domain-containing protein [Erysipelotrichaceae bacterium]|nr:helix-turn-helix domain-containing protein [Erysipelotrichaceae bacterium]
MSRISKKNNMRTPEEKEAIVLEYLNGIVGHREVAAAHGVDRVLLQRWIKKYRESGIEGLRSRTGRHSNPNKGKYNRYPSEVEKLKKELLKKEIEIERLKKGYLVKGGGETKEYVTTFDANTKS